MATRSSLGFIADATTVRLSNGSIEVNASTLTANNLQPSTTLKTDSNKNIVSADLYLSDIKDYVPAPASVSNPMIEDLDANDFKINNCTNIETLEQRTQYITAVEEFGETQFSGGILVNGLISNANELLFDNGSKLTADNNDLLLSSNNNIKTNTNIVTDFDISCGTLTATDIVNTDITNLKTKTQYQSVNTALNSTLFNGIVNPSLTLSIGNAQPNQTGYNLPSARPLSAGYVMVTPANTGNTLVFTLASDPAKVQNLSASTGQSTFAGILNVGSELKVNSLSTLVGGALVNQKITLTKNIIEIQEDGVYTQAIVIGNILTTGYALPRTNSTAGSELRLNSTNNLEWYSSATYIRFNRNITLGSISLQTTPIDTRLSVFPLLVNESVSTAGIFNTTISGVEYISTQPRKAFSMSYNAMAYISVNPAGGTYVFRLIHRRLGNPVESVISAYRIMMSKDTPYTISLQSVAFDIAQGDIFDVSIEGSIISTINLDSQQVSILAH